MVPRFFTILATACLLSMAATNAPSALAGGSLGSAKAFTPTVSVHAPTVAAPSKANAPAAKPSLRIVPNASATRARAAGGRQDVAKAPYVSAPRLTKAPKLVVYDWDGTLGDTYDQLRYIVSNAARDVGIPEPAIVNGVDPYRAIIDGSGLEVMFRRLAPNGTHAEEAKFIERFQAHTETAPPELVKLKPGVLEELRALKQQFPKTKIAIFSSRPQGVVEAFVKHAGIGDIVSMMVGTGGSKIPEKPAPDGLFHITRTLDVAPQEALMVGDTTMDIGAGKAAGIKTVALRDGMGRTDDLHAMQPDYALDSLTGFVDGVLPAKRAPVLFLDRQLESSAR